MAFPAPITAIALVISRLETGGETGAMTGNSVGSAIGDDAAPASTMSITGMESPQLVQSTDPPMRPDQNPADAGRHQGDIVVTAHPRAAPGDPFEGVNAKSFAMTQAVDKAFVGPAAHAYQRILPRPLRGGLHNLLVNLSEPVIFVNFVLQFKPGKAAETFGRFAVNSTIGGAGLFDVAKNRPFHLPHRPNGFAYTFGYYGVRPGPYMYLPLVGPTTLRDVVGSGLDRLFLPVAVGAPFNRIAFSVSTGAVSALDRRVEQDDRLKMLRDESGNPYAAIRDFYLRKRQAEIEELRGRRHAPTSPSSGIASPAADTVALSTSPATSECMTLSSPATEHKAFPLQPGIPVESRLIPSGSSAFAVEGRSSSPAVVRPMASCRDIYQSTEGRR